MGGVTPYREAWSLQERLQHRLISRKRKNPDSKTLLEYPKHMPAGYLMLLEHPHVYTIGKSGDIKNLLFTEEVLEKRGIDVIRTDRGGDITYHGPGQLVGYPVLDLEQFGLGVAAYLNKLEEVIIRTTAFFGITSKRIPSRTGVWVGNSKICAMGIKCSRYVTMHGFALNIHTDLSLFQGIIPCGIHEGGVASFQNILSPAPSLHQVHDQLLKEFGRVFSCRLDQKPQIPGFSATPS